MTEEKSHEDGELFATDQNEELADEASTTQDESKDELFESSEGEESEGEHADSEATQKTTASEIKQKQIDAWQKKIDSGAATIADLPKNQKWMATSLKARQEVDIEKLADEIIERKLRDKDEEKSFEGLKSRVVSAGLSSKKTAQITEEYNELRSMGLSKAKALEKAIRIAGVEFENDSGTLPPMGSYNPKPKEDKNLTSEERVKRLEQLRKKSTRLQAA